MNDARPIYCVCDGADKKQTVILGAEVSDEVFSRVQAFIVGLFPHSDNILSVEYMKEKHLQNVGVSGIDVSSIHIIFIFVKRGTASPFHTFAFYIIHLFIGRLQGCEQFCHIWV